MARRSRDLRRPRGPGYRLRKREWVDPFPGVLGTKPEKMLYAVFMEFNIPFAFQWNIRDIPGVPGIENWRVDFYIPAIRLVIEVNGDYWHTLGDAPARDAFRYAAMEQAGYKVYAWWESDIVERVWEMVASDPLLRACPKGPPVKATNETDDLKALRRMNAMRAKKSATVYRRSRRVRRSKSREGVASRTR